MIKGKVRALTPRDAQDLHTLQQDLDQETDFMLLYPWERTMTPEKLAKLIAEDNHCFIGAYLEDELVGYISLEQGPYEKIRHTAYLVIGLRAHASGQGLGKQLMIAGEDWATRRGIHRLELTVMVTNQPGIGLYQKRGFEIEGIKKDSIKMDNHYIDEYYMAKLID